MEESKCNEHLKILIIWILKMNLKLFLNKLNFLKEICMKAVCFCNGEI